MQVHILIHGHLLQIRVQFQIYIAFYTATITDVMGCTLVANYNLPSITSITN